MISAFAKRATLLSAAYALTVAAYAANAAAGGSSAITNIILKTLPVLTLCIVAWTSGGLRKWLLPTALLCSVLGDMFGECRIFAWQVVMFGMAHLLYILYFLRSVRFGRGALRGVILLATACIVFGAYLLPHISSHTERVLCGAYLLLITTMASSTLLCDKAHKTAYTIAAIIFILSDSCLAWNRFVEHISHAGTIIMATYFVAQYLFALLYIKECKSAKV